MFRVVPRSLSRSPSPFQITVHSYSRVPRLQVYFSTASVKSKSEPTYTAAKMRGSIQDFLDFVNASPTREYAMVQLEYVSNMGSTAFHTVRSARDRLMQAGFSIIRVRIRCLRVAYMNFETSVLTCCLIIGTRFLVDHYSSRREILSDQEWIVNRGICRGQELEGLSTLYRV